MASHHHYFIRNIIYFQSKQKMKNHHNFKQAQTTIEFLLGPIKIKDGLFMGDQLAAKDIEFIISNKVTHIINTVSKTVPNLYERFGIQYLSVHWTEKEENIFDKKNNAVNAIFSFVQEAMDAGESCLIHSVNGKSRACAVLVAYMMKKYSWSLSKCLEFVNLKKEGLEIRNNYLAQMQELEKRILAEGKLSSSWNEIKNEEDLILANTYYNSKRNENKVVTMPVKKQNTRKVAWNEKLIIKPAPQTNIQGTKFKEETPVQGKLKSILKGDQQDYKQEIQSNSQGFSEKEQKPTDDRFISTINGNIVHVTVNNFINTEKKPPAETPVKVYNTRPFSSDAKDREKKNIAQPNPTKLFPYDSSLSTTFKNPYEMKMIGKIGTNMKGIKKKEEIKNPLMTYDRPTSANIGSDKKKGTKVVTNNPLTEKLGYDMMITGSNSKKRYPSSNPKEDSFKWK